MRKTTRNSISLIEVTNICLMRLLIQLDSYPSYIFFPILGFAGRKSCVFAEVKVVAYFGSFPLHIADLVFCLIIILCISKLVK
jgi:hypothetical protein